MRNLAVKAGLRSVVHGRTEASEAGHVPEGIARRPERIPCAGRTVQRLPDYCQRRRAAGRFADRGLASPIMAVAVRQVPRRARPRRMPLGAGLDPGQVVAQAAGSGCQRAGRSAPEIAAMAPAGSARASWTGFL